MNSFIGTLLPLLIVFGGIAKAQGLTSSCAGCSAADQLASEFAHLSFQREDDRNKGDLKALEAVAQLEKFEKLPKSSPDRQNLFEHLVALAREASPYDGESQLAQIVAAWFQRDPSLKRAYDIEIAAMLKAPPGAELCKSRQLESRVREASCLKAAKLTGQAPTGADQTAKVLACTDSFNFENCLQGKN